MKYKDGCMPEKSKVHAYKAKFSSEFYLQGYFMQKRLKAGTYLE